MRYIKIKIPNPCNFFMISDAHVSSIAFKQNIFEDCIGFIASDPEHNVVAGLGDFCNTILPKDKRHAVGEVNPAFPNFESERRYIKQQFRRFEHPELDINQMKALLTGNHEEYLSSEIGDVMESIADDLGVAYGGRICMVECEQENPDDPENPYVIHGLLMHGAGSLGSTIPDMFERNHTLRRGLRKKFLNLNVDADFYACGHFHKLIEVKPERDTRMGFDEQGRIKAYSQWEGQPMMAVPSFLAAYAPDVITYEESSGRRLNELGCGYFIIEDGVVVDMADIYYI